MLHPPDATGGRYPKGPYISFFGHRGRPQLSRRPLPLHISGLILDFEYLATQRSIDRGLKTSLSEVSERDVARSDPMSPLASFWAL